MKPTRLRRSFLRHGLKTWALMLLLLTPVIIFGDYMPGWLFYLLFFGTFLLVIMPIHFGVGPLGRRFSKELNDAAVADDKEYRGSLGPPRSESETDESLR